MNKWKIGDHAFRRKDYHNRTEWILFTINETYLPIMNEFPEDYRTPQEQFEV